MANKPIGPHPVTAIAPPDRGPANAVCTAFPHGSITAATSSGTFAGARHAFTAGTATYSANPPLMSTPRILVFSHTCALPLRHAGHVPHTTWLSHETRSPTESP